MVPCKREASLTLGRDLRRVLLEIFVGLNLAHKNDMHGNINTIETEIYLFLNKWNNNKQDILDIFGERQVYY